MIHMTVRELSRNQLIELKQNYLTQNNESISQGELANADDIVSDETIFNQYEGVRFTEDDFFAQ